MFIENRICGKYISVIVVIYDNDGVSADWRGCVFFQAEDGIRDLVRSRGLGDVYKRQGDDRRVGAAAIGVQGEAVALAGHQLEHLLEILGLSLIHI
mgnify:CR=1 FL=1